MSRRKTMSAVNFQAEKKKSEAPSKEAIINGMSQEIKDTVITSMMLRESSARLVAVEKEFFTDNRRLI